MTVFENNFLFFLPIENPIIPSVEKAYESKINAERNIRLIKIVLAAIYSSPILPLRYVNQKKEKVNKIVLRNIFKFISIKLLILEIFKISLIFKLISVYLFKK